MASLSSVALAACFAAASLLAPAQNTEDVHAPDGGTQEMTSSISIPPVTNAPFQATVTLEWTKHLADGSIIVIKNHRLVVRDSQGSIYQERRTLVPEGSSQEPRVRSIEISSPVTHTKYFCDPGLTRCELRNYEVRVADPAVLAGANAKGSGNLSQTNLGTKIIEGLDAVGTRETITIQPGVIGNSASVENTKEFWYSAQLGLNLRVLRLDPLHGDQSLAVTNIKLSEPDPQLFVLPPTSKIVDLRTEEHQQ